MAKKSAIEKNKNRRELVKQYAAKRARLKAAIADESLSDQERFPARLKLAELPRNSVADAHPQPLRDHRPAARLLPQAQDVPHRAARAGQRLARSRAWSSRAGRRRRCR